MPRRRGRVLDLDDERGLQRASRKLHDRLALDVSEDAPLPSLTYNVLDYGADPTGIVDSAAAFSAAVAAMPSSGGILVVPAGTYLLASTVTLDRPVRILGEAADDTVSRITFTGSGAGFNIQHAYCHLENLYLLDGAAATFMVSVTSGYCTVRNCGFTVSVIGVSTGNGSGFVVIEGCTFSVESGATAGVSINGHRTIVRDCQFDAISGTPARALRIVGSTKALVDGCEIDGFTTGIEVSAGITDFTLVNNDIRNCTTGISVAAGASDRYIIATNNLAVSVTTALSDGGTGTDTIIASNLPASINQAAGGSMTWQTTQNRRVYPSAASTVTATSGGSAWASGSWVEIIAASTETVEFYLAALTFKNNSGSANQFEVDVGTGGAGAETVIGTVKLAEMANNAEARAEILPLRTIAANARVAVRVRSSAGSKTLGIGAEIVRSAL